MNKPNKNSPPRWADRFLEWYCRQELLEEIQGDSHELFSRTARRNQHKARYQFIWNVLRFFRWKNIRKSSANSYSPNSLDMIMSYFITGFRAIQRNLVSSSINIVGLSIALACGISIFIILNSYYNLDEFHEKGDRLFLLMNKIKTGDNIENWASSPYLLGPALKDENTALESAVRIQRHGGVSVRQGDHVFSESVWFVDPDFFNAFSFRIVNGDVRALNNKNSIIISRENAEKYFGSQDPVGKELSLKFWNEEKKVFQVGAVIDVDQDRSSMFIGFLIPMPVWEDLQEEPVQWRTWTSSTFALLKEGHHPTELQKSLVHYRKLQNEANEKFQMQGVEFIPMGDVAQRSYEISNSLSWGNIPAAQIALSVIALALVLVACFNYMNVAVASVSTRLKEIGIRKVIGGGKYQIIQQFLVENMILCALALFVGTGIAYLFLIPGFNSLLPIHVPFTFSSTGTLIGFFAGTLVFIALVSGAYPALYVSSFSPIKILRGKEKFGSKSTLSKVLLSFQFTLSFMTIVGCLVFVSSGNYFERKDWGYDHAQNFFVPLQSKEQFSAMRDKVAEHEHITSYAGAESHVGYQNQITAVRYREKELNTTRFGIGFGYLEAMGVRLIEGRLFDRFIESDQVESIIVNEAFVRNLGVTKPLNEAVVVDSVKRYIIGVVEDFYMRDFYSDVEPSFFQISPEEDFRYLIVKARGGQAHEVGEFLLNSWKKIAPDDPYRGRPQDDVFATFYNSNRANNKIVYFISFVALILSCMGLYGLVSYSLTRRLREFSVRKVFGANLFHIFKLMNRDYLLSVLLSFAIGAPLGYYLIGMFLKASYPEQIPVGAGPFVIALLLITTVITITIASQLSRVVRENPVETLRSE